jgi:hypothetical protein
MNLRRIVISVVALALTFAPASMEGSGRETTSVPGEAPRYSGYEVSPSPVSSIPDVRRATAARNRTSAHDRLPDAPRHPLIILSPGFGSSHRGYVGLSSYWARTTTS